MNKTLAIISLILFFAVTSVHLYASLKQDKDLRAKTKPFILLTLLAFYCFATDNISATVVLALFFSWLGDVLLIPEGNKWFVAGGISFMISHFFFMVTYALLTDFSKVHPAFTIIIPLIFAIAAVITFKYLRPYLPKALFWPMLLYLIINGGMNSFAWFRSLSSPGSAAIITAFGALLFYISDTTLFFVRFKNDSKARTHFMVMLTYALGEFLIVLGLIL